MMAKQSIYQLPASLQNDLEQMRLMTEQFQQGAINASRFQAFRVPQGVYEQRESGSFMLRVRLPAFSKIRGFNPGDVAEPRALGMPTIIGERKAGGHAAGMESCPHHRRYKHLRPDRFSFQWHGGGRYAHAATPSGLGRRGPACEFSLAFGGAKPALCSIRLICAMIAS